MSVKLILAITLTTLVGLSVYNMYSNVSDLKEDGFDRAMFNQWLMKNGKSYGNDDEKEYRYQNFKSNSSKVGENKSNSYRLGLNKFADLNSTEFAAKYLGFNETAYRLKTQKKNYKSLNHIKASEEKDWVEEDKVNAVKDQGACGSCWAFSATAALETRKALDSGELPIFSEQALVDCGGEYGTYGCSGGFMDPAFQWSAEHGMVNSRDYPYTARDGSCKVDSMNTVKVNKSYFDVPVDNNQELVNAISETVVSVAIAAEPMQLYTGGVFDDWSCGNQLDHGVAAVGYGVDSETGKKFYKIRNSWGGDWGEFGYVRFERRDSGEGMCGVTNAASYPTN